MISMIMKKQEQFLKVSLEKRQRIVITVLHLIESLRAGGAERRLVNDLINIDKKKFKNIVCCLFNNKELLNDLDVYNIPVYFFGMRHNFDLYNFFKGFLNVFRKYRHSIGILHTQLFFSNIYGRIFGRILGFKRIVTTFQYPDYDKDNSGNYSFKRKIIDYYSSKLNCGFIAVSEYVKKSFISKLKLQKPVHVIYNYVDERRVNEKIKRSSVSIKEELKVKNNEIMLISVGRLEVQKGYEYLIESMVKIVESRSKVKLFIAGEGSMEEKLSNMIQELSLQDNIFLLGQRKDVLELINACDIFVLVSLNEGLSVALLEAMILKRLCIVSDIPSNREVIIDGFNGFLSKKQSSLSIQNVLDKVLQNKENLYFCRENAKKSVMEMFSVKSNIQKLEMFYETITNDVL